MLTLPPLLVRYSKTQNAAHGLHPPERLPELMQRFENTNLSLMTRCLLKWQLLTLVRPGEAAGTMWSEIDTEKNSGPFRQNG